MDKTPIEQTSEFQFIKQFVREIGVESNSTEEILNEVGYGIGFFRGVTAQRFLESIRTSILSHFDGRFVNFVLNSDNYSKMDEESKRIYLIHMRYNPEVAATFIKEADLTSPHNILRVLTTYSLSNSEKKEVVNKSENWRNFFLRVSKEFSKDKIGGGWDFDYPLNLESLALGADPSIVRDYKNTGKGLDILTMQNEFCGLNVDGFTQGKSLGFDNRLLLINLDKRLAEKLIGKDVEYHLKGYSREGLRPYGELVRILD